MGEVKSRDHLAPFMGPIALNRQTRLLQDLLLLPSDYDVGCEMWCKALTFHIPH